MNCPRCRATTLEGANFCQHCGEALIETRPLCPQCGTALVPGTKFCHNCGRPLAKPSIDPALDRLQKFIPKELLARLETAHSQRTPGGERRVITMLFCDVKGSTALAEQLDPEDWADVMNEVFEYLIAPVYQYEGLVARLMGDAILAFFGAPIAHEDDPQRAVLAGLGIVEGIQTYRERVKRERGLDFNVRVGINTGLAVVGEVGSDLRVEYTAMGDAVNLAARMEQTAQPGTVQISGNTYKLIAPLFECESLGSIEVKGKAQLVPAYRVLRPKTKPGRLRGIEGLEASLVGREKEWTTLKNTMAEARAGHGGIILLSGEAGLGKSRLIHELHDEWKRSAPIEARALWGETSSASYTASQPYGQFQQLIRNMNRISEADPPETVRQKIERAATILAPDRRLRAIQILGVLLAVEPASDTEGLHLEGEAFNNELVNLLLDLYRAWASAAPAIVVFDDLHWADPASVELLTRLFVLTGERPTLFLCAFRPDLNSPALAVKEAAETHYAHCCTEIGLSPLTSQESAALVRDLLDISSLPPALRELIYQKTEGNPFFVEEVVRSLIDSGAVVRQAEGGWQMAAEAQVTIPDNVQALLSARIDRLDEAARYILHLAAVIGRSFDYTVLKTITEAADQLDTQLTTLQQADLIRETAEGAYSFRHALTQETAYQSILLKRRREYHRRTGEALESLFPAHLVDHAPVLGHHFYEAHDSSRALKYLTLAGDSSLRLYANAEAVVHYGRALEVAGQLPNVSGEQVVHLYLNRGQALELNTQYDIALEGYVVLETFGCDQGNPAVELMALMARIKLHSTPTPHYDLSKSQNLSVQALALARELGDRTAAARLLWNLMMLGLATGQLSQSVDYGQQAIALARELNLREQLAFTLQDIHRSYRATGQLALAQAVLAESQTLWRELDNRPMLADNLASSAVLDYLLGNWPQVLVAAEEAHQISLDIQNQWGVAYSQESLGYIQFEYGEPEQAIARLGQSAQISEQAGMTAIFAGTGSELAWVYGCLGAIEPGLKLCQAALTAAENHFPVVRAWPLAILARLHGLAGNLAEARATLELCQSDPHRDSAATFAPFHLALAEAEIALLVQGYPSAVQSMDDFLIRLQRMGVRAFLAEALLYKGRALIGLGRIDEARETLLQARREAEALGSQRSLWVILYTLGQLEGQRGSLAEAEYLSQAASAIVTSISNHCPATFQESFLNLPMVRMVLRESKEM